MSLNKTITLLSERSLKRLTYHWYWGLVTTTDENKSLWSYMHGMLEPDATVRLKMDNIEKIRERWYAPLYWIFNINNYRFNSYLCGVYCSYLLFDEVLLQLDEQSQQTALNQGFYYLLPQHSFTNLTTRNYMFSEVIYNPLQGILPDLKFTDRSSSKSIEMILRASNKSSSMPKERVENRGESSHENICTTLYKGVINGATWVASFFRPHQDSLEPVIDSVQITQEPPVDGFHVMPHILSRVRFFEIKREGDELIEVGDIVTYAEFKKAYRKKLLETHPDMTRGSTGGDFIEVHVTYKYVLTQVDPNISEEDKLTASIIERDRLHKENEELTKKIRAKDEELVQLEEKMREQAETLKKLISDMRELNAGLEQRERELEMELAMKDIIPPQAIQRDVAIEMQENENGHEIYMRAFEREVTEVHARTERKEQMERELAAMASSCPS